MTTGGRQWTELDDRILLRCRPRMTFAEICRVYLPNRTAGSAQVRYKLLGERGYETKAKIPKKTLEPPAPPKATSEEDASQRLYRAMLGYGLRHGHLLSLSMAQIRVRAAAEGVRA